MLAGTSALNDRELAGEIAAGSEAAFRELYARHTPRVFQLIRRLVGGQKLDAEDILQEVWLHAVRALPRFRWEATFSTWITGIAINETRTWWRRKGSRLFDSIEVDAAALHTHAAPVGDRLDLESALSRLPDGQRVVLVLHDVEGLTHGEIAERLGVAVGTSKSQLFAARRTMRAYLAPAPVARVNGESPCPYPKTI